MSMLIVRGDLGDPTVALCAHLLAQNLPFTLIDVDTGWHSSLWPARRKAIQDWLISHNIASVTLKSAIGFPEMVAQRGMPSPKFSWCTLHLKGIPFNTYLDEQDPLGEATVVLPRVGAYLKYPITQYIEACPYHGERRVWHPLWNSSVEAIERLVQTTPIPYLGHRALECAPCIYHTHTLSALTPQDIKRAEQLEATNGPIIASVRVGGVCGIAKQCAAAKDQTEPPFNTGCGDPFACGN